MDFSKPYKTVKYSEKAGVRPLNMAILSDINKDTPKTAAKLVGSPHGFDIVVTDSLLAEALTSRNRSNSHQFF